MQLTAPCRASRPLGALRTAVSCLVFLFAASATSAVPAARPSTPASVNAGGPSSAAPAGWVHAYAAFGEPRYPRNFDHFDYLNPAAPKGGTLYLPNPDRRTTFDKLNYFTIRGNAPAGVAIFMVETLAYQGADELQTMYGLLAEEMLVAPDKSAITFRLNPKARFSNGDPVTAADVKYSFDIMSGLMVLPGYASDYAGVARAVVLDDRTIRFELKEKSSAQMFKLGRLPVFSHTWGLKPDGSHTPFDQIVNEPVIASGPYTIAGAESGRRIEFKRDPNYWARDLPVRRGMYNFDRIVKKKVPTGTGIGLQAYEINLRRPIFSDIRVRQAFGLTYDWETNNRYPGFGLQRANSLFNNSEFAAQGLPSPGELALLEPYRRELPAEVFGPPFVAPRTDHDPNQLRRNLLQARALMEAAGWKLDASGVLRDAKGEPFVVEFLAPSGQDTDRRMNPWRHNAERLGMAIRDRRVDFALFDRRLQEFDFDMVTIVEPDFQLPQVADYIGLYGSQAADTKASNNLRGVKSKAVDNILEAMARASTLADFRDACRALDRVVMWSHWQVPELYQATENMAYWNKFGMPAVFPKHFTTDVAPDLDIRLPWPIVAWWAKDLEKH